MKTFLKSAFAALALLAISVQAQVPTVAIDPLGYNAWSGGTTNGNTALSWCIVPARSSILGTPVVEYINASSDLVLAAVTNYTCTTQQSVNYTNSTVYIPITSTNGFASGDYVVIRHQLTDNYEKRVLTTPVNSTNIVLTVAPIETTVPGDIVYRYQGLGSAFIAFNAAGTNISINSTRPIFAGQRGKPMLIEVNATTRGSVNAVTATWLP